MCGDQLKIHLLFEAVYFENSHFHFVAQFDDVAGAAAYEMVAGWFKHVEIILDGRKMHQPAHAQCGHVNEKAKVAQINNQSGILRRLAGLQLRFEEGEHFDVFAVSFRIGGIAFGV